MKKKYITFGGKEVEIDIENAEGTEGFLLYDGSHFWFRIYDEDHGFEDFQIWHHDLKIKIVDDFASFYRAEDGKKYLDHSPEALGWKKEDNNKEE